MQSKYYFEDFKDEIKEEKELFKARQEARQIDTRRCDHKGKVKIDHNELVCVCGAHWTGPQIETLYKLLMV